MKIHSTKHLPSKGPFEVSLGLDLGGIQADSAQAAVQLALDGLRMLQELGIVTSLHLGPVVHACPAEGPVEGFLIKRDGSVEYSAADSD